LGVIVVVVAGIIVGLWAWKKFKTTEDENSVKEVDENMFAHIEKPVMQSTDQLPT
jgi:Na+/glutamate symporter